MVTVTLDELEVNAVLAGLDARVARLSRNLANLKEQRDTPSNRFAIEATEAGIRHAIKAQLRIADAYPDPEYPASMTLSQLPTEAESRAMWGDR